MINKPRASAEQAEVPRVVVGVDGSPASIRALQYAAEEAAWRGATLVIVNAWQRPEGAAYPGYAVVTMEPAAAFEQRSRELIDEALSNAFGLDGPPVPVTTRTVESGAAAALLTVATGATMLVVGSRGLGGLRSMLGSTSRRCVTHASCPVLVVRPAGVHAPGAHGAGAAAHRHEIEPPMRTPLF